MKNRRRNLIRDERGELSYFSTGVYIIIAVLMLTLIMDVLAIVMTKQKLDSSADQVTRQIQLAGKVDADTDSLLAFLAGDLVKATNVNYSVNTTYISKGGCNTAIQLGTPFHLTLSADVQLGGFWNIIGRTMTLESVSAGVSERYWK